MRILPSKGYVLALALSAAFAAAYALQRDLPAQYRFYEKTEDYTANMRVEYDARVAEEQRLVDRVDGLERDPIEMEENIRHQRQLARPGERVFRIEPGPAPSSP
ncbi:MAG: hypothetical protein HUU46_11510 [Candidatus Hydrogenedentes bacterium]|nr:hypothetical protein [Candidatus Hydrogenedentota bacterium]